jgi:dipeptidyl aminopeptidase/acylaminoacyl peptidase
MALTAPVSLKAQEQRKRAITFQDLISMHRLSEPQVSPDGKWIAYAVSTPDLEANKSVRNIWIVSASGGQPKQLTRGGTDARPRWSPDGKKLAFLSSRVENNPQVYWMNLQGGEANRVTSLSTGADNELWSPDGKTIAFVSAVYPDCQDDACNARRDTEKQKSKVKARIYEKLLYRHWTGWSDGKRSHLFVVSAGGGTPRDLTPGADYDVPPFNLGGPEPIAFSPDSKELSQRIPIRTKRSARMAIFSPCRFPARAVSGESPRILAMIGDRSIHPTGCGSPIAHKCSRAKNPTAGG